MSYSRPNQEEKFSLDEFVSDFDIDRISLGGAIFDLKKLTWLNARYLREDFSVDELMQRFQNWKLNDVYMKRMIPMMKHRLQTLGDLIPACSFLFTTEMEYDPELLIPKKRSMEDVPPVLQTLLFQIESITRWVSKDIEAHVHEVADFWEWPIRDVTSIMFTAIMGKSIGPPLFESMEILGLDISRRRLLNALETSGDLGKKKMKKLEKKWKTWLTEVNKI